MEWGDANAASGDYGVQARVVEFDRVVTRIADDVIAKVHEGRASVEAAVRMHCCHLLLEQRCLLQQDFAERERRSRDREEVRCWHAYRRIGLKDRGVVARRKAENLNLGNVLVSRAHDARSGAGMHFLFLLWRVTAATSAASSSAPSTARIGDDTACRRIDERSKDGSVSTKQSKCSRRRQADQENAPPSNGICHASDAWPVPTEKLWPPAPYSLTADAASISTVPSAPAPRRTPGTGTPPLPPPPIGAPPSSPLLFTAGGGSRTSLQVVTPPTSVQVVTPQMAPVSLDLCAPSLFGTTSSCSSFCGNYGLTPPQLFEAGMPMLTGGETFACPSMEKHMMPPPPTSALPFPQTVTALSPAAADIMATCWQRHAPTPPVARVYGMA